MSGVLTSRRSAWACEVVTKTVAGIQFKDLLSINRINGEFLLVVLGRWPIDQNLQRPLHPSEEIVLRGGGVIAALARMTTPGSDPILRP